MLGIIGNYQLKWLNSVLLCCTLVMMLLLPQVLMASHGPLTQVQQTQHQLEHDHAQESVLVSAELAHDHSSLSVDHSHESVDVYDINAIALENHPCHFLAYQYACLDLFIAVPEHPPRG